jgi:hypothetical protein
LPRAISAEEKNPCRGVTFIQKQSEINRMFFDAKFALPRVHPQVYELIPIRKGVAYAFGHIVFACPLSALCAGCR